MKFGHQWHRQSGINTSGTFQRNKTAQLNAIVAQLKNCQFAVYTATELKIITAASDNNGVPPRIFQLKSLPVLLDAVVTFFGPFVVLSPNGGFWFEPLLSSASDMFKHVIF